jgi:hypothetical protein
MTNKYSQFATNLKYEAEDIKGNYDNFDKFQRLKKKTTLIIAFQVILIFSYLLIGIFNQTFNSFLFQQQNIFWILEIIGFVIFTQGFIFFYIRNKNFPQTITKNEGARKTVFAISSVLMIASLAYMIYSLRVLMKYGPQTSELFTVIFLAACFIFMVSLIATLISKSI